MMESIKELYKIGRGPSSSHTIGPERACRIFKAQNPGATAFRVILYGSLAKTGRGHGTDAVIRKTLAPTDCTVDFDDSDTRTHLSWPESADPQKCKDQVVSPSQSLVIIKG